MPERNPRSRHQLPRLAGAVLSSWVGLTACSPSPSPSGMPWEAPATVAPLPFPVVGDLPAHAAPVTVPPLPVGQATLPPLRPQDPAEAVAVAFAEAATTLSFGDDAQAARARLAPLVSDDVAASQGVEDRGRAGRQWRVARQEVATGTAEAVIALEAEVGYLVVVAQRITSTSGIETPRVTVSVRVSPTPQGWRVTGTGGGA